MHLQLSFSFRKEKRAREKLCPFPLYFYYPIEQAQEVANTV